MNKHAQSLGKLGGIARSKALTPKRRAEIASLAALARKRQGGYGKGGKK